MRLYIVIDTKAGKPAKAAFGPLLVYPSRRPAALECRLANEAGNRYEVREYDCSPVAEGRGEG